MATMRNTYASRMELMDEWVVIRVPESEPSGVKSPVLVAEKSLDKAGFDVKTAPASKRKNVGIVAAVGPGRVSDFTGKVIPLDPRIVEGAEVHFAVTDGARPFRPAAMAEEMAKEDLWVI